MEAKRSWWQQIKKHRVAIGVVGIGLVVIIALIIIGYWFDWTGFNGYYQVTITRIISGTNAGTITRTEEYQPGKGLWDWLQLLGVLAIPVVVGFGAVWFTTRQGKVADAENTDNQRETVLQAYIDKMSELLLHEKLRDSTEDEVAKVARVRTLTLLDRLNADRKRSVLQFLYESKLIDKDKCIIHLMGANLSGINLRGADLRGANLSYADLRGADLTGAVLVDFMDIPPDVNMSDVSLSAGQIDAQVESLINVPAEADDQSIVDLYAGQLAAKDDDLRIPFLSGVFLYKANLSVVNLRGADLSDAYMIEADLSFANFKDAKVSEEQLKGAKSLTGATMHDGSIHP